MCICTAHHHKQPLSISISFSIAQTPTVRPRAHYILHYFGADLSLTSSQSDTITLRDNGYGLVYHAMCLFTPQLLLVLTAPTHGEMAKAELTWFCAEVVYLT